MGLRFDKERAVERKPYYGKLDSTLRKQMQSGAIIIPILQQQSVEEDMSRYSEREVIGSLSSTSSARIYGNHLKIRSIEWGQTGVGSNFSYSINFNGYTFQTGTGSGAFDYAAVTTTDFNDKIIEETDYFEIICVKTGGTDPTAKIKLKGWTN